MTDGPARAPDPGLAGIRVSIDASAIPERIGGVGRYLIGILGAMAEHPECQITLITRRGDVARWAGADPRAAIRDRSPVGRAGRLLWEQAFLPRELALTRADVHHGPHYTMPVLAKAPCVVTIHDMTMVTHPEWHERSKVIFFKHAITRACARADVLVCISQHTADLLQEFRAPSGDIVVAPHGVDHTMFTPVGDPDRDGEVLRRLGLRGPYTLFLGTVEPRKNVPVLISAFEAIAGKYPDLRLVIAGAQGWDEKRVREATGASRYSKRIVRLGYVPDVEIPALLRRAAAVAYPSLEEGFGLPVLEALACGAPTVTTSGTVMEEVSGGAALLVERGSVTGLAAALDELVHASGQESRVNAGIGVAARYTWEASAERHMEAYRLAVSRHR